MGKTSHDILILGAGLTGLTAAYRLRQTGKSILVIDQQARPGGVLQSHREAGYTLDFGANSMGLTPELRKLIVDLDLEDQLLLASPESNKRYLYRDNKLHAVQPNPKVLLQSQLLSLAGKLRFLSEPLRPRRKEASAESVAAFFSRRLGREAFTYMIEPILTGIYAGDASRMSVEAVMPQVVAWEQESGSLFKGFMRQQKARKKAGLPARQIASFRGGMKTFVDALANSVHDTLRLSTRLTALHSHEGGFSADVSSEGISQTYEAKQVLWTLPVSAVSALDAIDRNIAQQLSHIPHPPMLMYSLAYAHADIGQPLDSFGFLVPSAEQQPFLGAIWNSTVFKDDKALAGTALFTLFVGGARHMGATEAELLQVAKAAKDRFEVIMRISGVSKFSHHYYWPLAIPQYELGHEHLVNAARSLEDAQPGLFFSANWMDGVSVGDRVKAAYAAIERMV